MDKENNKSMAKKIISLILIACFLVFPLGVIFGGITTGLQLFLDPVIQMYEESQALLSHINEETFSRREDTQIYDCNGELISEINVTNYKYADIDHISPYIYKAYISVEDKTFMTHNGYDIKAILRAALALVKNKGEITQGGSTITQQVIKNNFLIGRPKVERKIMELFMAPKLEQQMSKDAIMEAYCNTNFYGHNCYGVETASLYYFGKHANELTLSESAILAGISNLPGRYDPKKSPELVLSKRNNVLNAMLDDGAISIEEYLAGRREQPVYVFEKEIRTPEDYMTSYAIHCATKSLMEQNRFEFQYQFKTKEEYKSYQDYYQETYSTIASDIRLGGYRIYTSLDPKLQNILQEAVNESVKNYRERGTNGMYALQSAAVAVDNKTGYIVAIVGGREEEGEFNRGYQAIRQPGSAIKPVLVYGPAFDTGFYYPTKQVVDEYIPKGPKNAYTGYKGPMSVYEAIGRSVNTIAYKTFLDIGASYAVSYLENMRFSHLSHLDQSNSSMSIGGFTYGVSVDEMAKAYSTLENNGVYTENDCIKKIEFFHSGVLFEEKNEKIQVYDPASAYMTLSCMEGVLTEPYGTGRSRKLHGITAAAKTGTTDESKDIWFCGTTTDYALAVWCGYDTPRASHNFSGARYPGYTWKTFLENVHEGKPNEEFVRPDTVVTRNVNYRGEPVFYYSGRTGLFSIEHERRVEEEKRKREEEQHKQEQLQQQQKIEQLLSDFSEFSLSSYKDAIPFLNQENILFQEISKLDDVMLRTNYEDRVRLVGHKIRLDSKLPKDPENIFFVAEDSEEQAQNILDRFFDQKAQERHWIQEIESYLAVLTSIESIDEESIQTVQNQIDVIESSLKSAPTGIDTIVFDQIFEREKERIHVLIDNYLTQQILTEEMPEEALDPGLTIYDESEPGKITYALQMIEFLRTIYPDDPAKEMYISSAREAVEACKNMMEYEALRAGLWDEINRLMG